MSFFARRTALPTVSISRLEVIRRADNEPLISCCRHLADRARRTDPNPTLQRQLLAISAEFDRVQAQPELSSQIRSGDQPWPIAAPHLLDLLLAAASTALTSDPSLTALIADTVLRARRGSRAAWRLRALAHEQWGDLGSAIDAHQQYLTLIDVDADRLGVRARVRGLGELREARSMLGSALSQAEELGVRLPEPGADELLDLLTRPTRPETIDPVLEEFVSDLARLPIEELITIQDVVHAAIRCQRTAALRPGPLPAADVQDLTVIRLGDLRRWLDGRTICLVGDDDLVEDYGIEDYDLVTRFAPVRIVPAITGRRTDLLVSTHDEPTGWEQPTDLRMVLAEDPRDWVTSVRRNLVPAAQHALLDKTLRRPASQPAIVGSTAAVDPSAIYQVLRLIDHLDVSPMIDLIGVDLGRLADDEQKWVRARIRRADGRRVSLR